MFGAVAKEETFGSSVKTNERPIPDEQEEEQSGHEEDRDGSNEGDADDGSHNEDEVHHHHAPVDEQQPATLVASTARDGDTGGTDGEETSDGDAEGDEDHGSDALDVESGNDRKHDHRRDTESGRSSSSSDSRQQIQNNMKRKWTWPKFTFQWTLLSSSIVLGLVLTFVMFLTVAVFGIFITEQERRAGKGEGGGECSTHFAVDSQQIDANPPYGRINRHATTSDNDDHGDRRLTFNFSLVPLVASSLYLPAIDWAERLLVMSRYTRTDDGYTTATTGAAAGAGGGAAGGLSMNLLDADGAGAQGDGEFLGILGDAAEHQSNVHRAAKRRATVPLFTEFDEDVAVLRRHVERTAASLAAAHNSYLNHHFQQQQASGSSSSSGQPVQQVQVEQCQCSTDPDGWFLRSNATSTVVVLDNATATAAAESASSAFAADASGSNTTTTDGNATATTDVEGTFGANSYTIPYGARAAAIDEQQHMDASLDLVTLPPVFCAIAEEPQQEAQGGVGNHQERSYLWVGPILPTDNVLTAIVQRQQQQASAAASASASPSSSQTSAPQGEWWYGTLNACRLYAPFLFQQSACGNWAEDLTLLSRPSTPLWNTTSTTTTSAAVAAAVQCGVRKADLLQYVHDTYISSGGAREGWVLQTPSSTVTMTTTTAPDAADDDENGDGDGIVRVAAVPTIVGPFPEELTIAAAAAAAGGQGEETSTSSPTADSADGSNSSSSSSYSTSSTSGSGGSSSSSSVSVRRRRQVAVELATSSSSASASASSSANTTTTTTGSATASSTGSTTSDASSSANASNATTSSSSSSAASTGSSSGSATISGNPNPPPATQTLNNIVMNFTRRGRVFKTLTTTTTQQQQEQLCDMHTLRTSFPSSSAGGMVGGGDGGNSLELTFCLRTHKFMSTFVEAVSSTPQQHGTEVVSISLILQPPAATRSGAAAVGRGTGVDVSLMEWSIVKHGSAFLGLAFFLSALYGFVCSVGIGWVLLLWPLRVALNGAWPFRGRISRIVPFFSNELDELVLDGTTFSPTVEFGDGEEAAAGSGGVTGRRSSRGNVDNSSSLFGELTFGPGRATGATSYDALPPVAALETSDASSFSGLIHAPPGRGTYTSAGGLGVGVGGGAVVTTTHLVASSGVRKKTHPPLFLQKNADSQTKGFRSSTGSVAHVVFNNFFKLAEADSVEAENTAGDFLSECFTGAAATDGFVLAYTADSCTICWNVEVPKMAHESAAVSFAEAMMPKLSSYPGTRIALASGQLFHSKNVRPTIVVGEAISHATLLSVLQKQAPFARVLITENIVFKTSLNKQTHRLLPVDIVQFPAPGAMGAASPHQQATSSAALSVTSSIPGAAMIRASSGGDGSGGGGGGGAQLRPTTIYELLPVGAALTQAGGGSRQGAEQQYATWNRIFAALQRLDLHQCSQLLLLINQQQITSPSDLSVPPPLTDVRRAARMQALVSHLLQEEKNKQATTKDDVAADGGGGGKGMLAELLQRGMYVREARCWMSDEALMPLSYAYYCYHSALATSSSADRAGRITGFGAVNNSIRRMSGTLAYTAAAAEAGGTAAAVAPGDYQQASFASFPSVGQTSFAQITSPGSAGGGLGGGGVAEGSSERAVRGGVLPPPLPPPPPLMGINGASGGREPSSSVIRSVGCATEFSVQSQSSNQQDPSESGSPYRQLGPPLGGGGETLGGASDSAAPSPQSSSAMASATDGKLWSSAMPGEGSERGDSKSSTPQHHQVQSHTTDYSFLPLVIADVNTNREWTRSDKVVARQRWGRVFSGMRSDGCPVVLLVTDWETTDPLLRPFIANGARVGALVQHLHSVRFAFNGEVNHRFFISVVDYIPGGELRAFIEELKCLLHECVRRYAREILEVIRFLHSRGIVHRAVCPSNILLSMSGKCLLTNYRYSVLLQDSSGNTRRGAAGSPAGATSPTSANPQHHPASRRQYFQHPFSTEDAVLHCCVADMVQPEDKPYIAPELHSHNQRPPTPSSSTSSAVVGAVAPQMSSESFQNTLPVVFSSSACDVFGFGVTVLAMVAGNEAVEQISAKLIPKRSANSNEDSRQQQDDVAAEAVATGVNDPSDCVVAPVVAVSEEDIAGLIRQRNAFLASPLNGRLLGDCANLLARCLHPDPMERPRSDQLLFHPFFL